MAMDSLYHSTYGEEMDILKQDQLIKSDPVDNRRRRTIAIKHQWCGKELPSCGFTLQSYGLLNLKSSNLRLLTFVDHVENDGPAQVAGLRPGDVILSVNGISMENADHETLVNLIRSSVPILRMIVIFEDCCRKIDLHVQFLKLQNTLSEKVHLLKALEAEEMNLLRGLSTHDTSSVYCSRRENSIFSYNSECNSDELLCSTDVEVFYIRDNAVRNVLGGVPSVSSECSGEKTMPHRIPNAVTFNSQDTAYDDVFSEAVTSNQYEYSSLPSDLTRKRNSSWKTSSTEIANPSLAPFVLKTAPSVLIAPKKKLTSASEGSHLAVPKLPEVPQGMKARLSSRAAEGSLRICKLRDSFKHRMNSDFCLSTRRPHQQVSNHVLSEDTVNADLPQLISLKRLCHDFRTSCLQQRLEQRRKSTDWMMSSFEPDFVGDNYLLMCRTSEAPSKKEFSFLDVEMYRNNVPHNYQENRFLTLSLPQSVTSLPEDSSTVELTCGSDKDVYINYVNTKDEFTKL